MKELNKLTQKLLSEGYSVENPPPQYIKWDVFYGGWQYHPTQTENMCVKTPCGLLQKAWFVHDVSFGGVDWCLENDNALVFCPYQEKSCPKNNPIIKDLKIGYGFFCEAKISNEPYDYEKSVAKIDKKNFELEEARIKEFAKTCKDGFCREQLCFNQITGEMWLDDDPIRCINSYCSYCTLRKLPISTKKGNVFYDLKITELVKGKGLIPDELKTSIIKGKRYFEKNTSITKCQWIAQKPEIIEEKERSRNAQQLFFSKFHGMHFEIEILNVRAETRESRDLDQDLQDLADGIEITHYSDTLAQSKEFKHKKRQKAETQRIQRLKKLIEQNGFKNIDKVEKIRVEKFIERGVIDYSAIDEWDNAYYHRNDEEQISFFEE